MLIQLPSLEALKNKPKITIDDKYTNTFYIHKDNIAISYIDKRLVGTIHECFVVRTDTLKSHAGVYLSIEFIEEIIRE